MTSSLLQPDVLSFFFFLCFNVVPTNWISDDSLTHIGDIYIDSFTNSVPGLLKRQPWTTWAHIKKLKSRINQLLGLILPPVN